MKLLSISLLVILFFSCSKKIEIFPLESYYTYDRVNKITLTLSGIQDSVIYIHDNPTSYKWGLTYSDSLNKSLENIYNVEKYINGIKNNDSTFTPINEGTYILQVKLGSITSNTKTVKVYELKKHITKINLQIPFGNQFKADGTSPIPIIPSIENDLNLKIESFKDLKYVINGKESSYSKIITASNIGKYDITIKGYGKESSKLGMEGIDKSLRVKYRIPVIFHILNFDIDPRNIKTYLDGVNLMFKNKSFRFSDILPQLSDRDSHVNPNRDNLDIEFYPAEYAPNGSKLDFPGLNIINGPSLEYQTEDIPIVAKDWDTNLYFNVHMFKKSKAELDKPNGWWGGLGGGICYIPVSGEKITNEKPYNYSIVLSHEIGHCFSLPHTFDVGCFSDPKIPNTYYYAKELKDVLETFERKTCDNKIIMGDNVMDYGGFINTFTDGQVELMRSAYEKDNIKMPSIKKVFGIKNGRTSSTEEIFICK